MAFSFKAMWKYKCPRCRQGDIFTKPFNIKKPLSMPERCEFCNQKTEPEPGFYFGAMFISYIASAWFLILPTLFFVFYMGWTVELAMAVTIGIGALSYLRFLRGSRSLWLHMMVKHNPDIESKVNEEIQSEKNKDWKPNLGSTGSS